MYHIFFIHSSVKGYLWCFQVLAITNNTAMNVVEHISLWYDWVSFGYIPKSGKTGSWGRLFPNSLKNHHTYFQISCTSEHTNQKCGSVPFTLHPVQHKLSVVFVILAFLTGVRWNLRPVLICLSLMARDVEPFLKRLSAIFICFICWEFSV